MPSYPRINFVQGSSPPINAANLNRMDAQLAAVQYGFNSLGASPYHLVSAVTINSSTTNTYTCTGVGGIPAGATMVLINCAFVSNTLNTFAAFGPHGSTLGTNANFPSSPLAQISGSIVITFSAMVPIDSNGQMDIKAFNGNCITMDVQINGYVY